MAGQKPSRANRSKVNRVEVSGKLDMNKGDEDKFKSHKYMGNPLKYFKQTLNKLRSK